MGRIVIEAAPTPDEKHWVPIIRISEEGTPDVRFILDGGFNTCEEAGDFIKWFWGLISDKSKQKKFVYSRDGMSSEEMKESLK